MNTIKEMLKETLEALIVLGIVIILFFLFAVAISLIFPGLLESQPDYSPNYN